MWTETPWISSRAIRALSLVVVSICLVSRAGADDASRLYDQIRWTVGPATVDLGDVGLLQVPSGYRFTDATGARLWNQLTGNPNSGDELGILTPPLETMSDPQRFWYISFQFVGCGYVKDDEKHSFSDAENNEILKAIRAATDKANEERRRQGTPVLTITGWSKAPFYDSVTHHLTWAINGHSTDGAVVNHNSRVLGRRGVLSVNLVGSPNVVSQTIPTYRMVVGGVSFKSGETYAEFRSGDQVAKYGLVGLITGGAAVAAGKSWKFLFKIGAVIVVALAALGRWIGSLFQRPAPAMAGAETGTATESSTSCEDTTIRCPSCGQQNRIAADRVSQRPRCGKCHSNLV